MTSDQASIPNRSTVSVYLFSALALALVLAAAGALTLPVLAVLGIAGLMCAPFLRLRPAMVPEPQPDSVVHVVWDDSAELLDDMFAYER